MQSFDEKQTTAKGLQKNKDSTFSQKVKINIVPESNMSYAPSRKTTTTISIMPDMLLKTNKETVSNGTHLWQSSGRRAELFFGMLYEIRDVAEIVHETLESILKSVGAR